MTTSTLSSLTSIDTSYANEMRRPEPSVSDVIKNNTSHKDAESSSQIGKDAAEADEGALVRITPTSTSRPTRPDNDNLYI